MNGTVEPQTTAPASPGETPDSVLMKRIVERDPDALDAFYERHAAAAHGLAMRILRDPADAQEVTQDAFLAVWRSEGYRAASGTPRGYLMAIVHNRAIDAVRRRRSRPVSASPEPLDFMPAPTETYGEATERETARILRGALEELPESQREAVALAFLGGLSHSDIASRLKEPIGTVKGRIRLGLARMRDTVPAELSELPAEVAA